MRRTWQLHKINKNHLKAEYKPGNRTIGQKDSQETNSHDFALYTFRHRIICLSCVYVCVFEKHLNKSKIVFNFNPVCQYFLVWLHVVCVSEDGIAVFSQCKLNTSNSSLYGQSARSSCCPVSVCLHMCVLSLCWYVVVKQRTQTLWLFLPIGINVLLCCLKVSHTPF